MSWLDSITNSMDMSLRTGKPGVLQFMGSQRVRHDWATEQKQQRIQLEDFFFFLSKCELSKYLSI